MKRLALAEGLGFNPAENGGSPLSYRERLVETSRSRYERKEVSGGACNGTVKTVPFRFLSSEFMNNPG
ncbi:MAG: hypothetical protein ACRD18_10740 [Terriglobia bacterium]